MEHDDNRLCLLSVNQTQEQRIKRLQRETEECQHERLHLLESINQYKHDNQVIFYLGHLFQAKYVFLKHRFSDRLVEFSGYVL